MSSEGTADPAPHDHDHDYRSLQSDRATTTPPLQPAPPPDPAPWLPPFRTFRQGFHSHSGHRGLTIWRSRWIDVRPPLSFQVYLAFDVHGWETWQIEAFADALWHECTPPPPTTAEEWQRCEQQQQLPQLLAHEPHSLPIRLDITILGPVAEIARYVTCVQHYRMTRQLESQCTAANDGVDYLWPAIPSCRGPNGVRYEGFLIQVLDPAYLTTGELSLLFFDATTDAGLPLGYGDDTLIVPTRPVQGGGNLWARELCHVWETMSMVKEWRDGYYEALVKQKGSVF